MITQGRSNMSIEFTGRSFAITADGLASVASGLGVNEPGVWTVLHVETSGCGFLPDRRPQILYERHIFSKLTGGRFDDGDISAPTAGGYGPTGAHQYDRLAQAIALDRQAALQSASWGLAQVMGMNYGAAGFPDIETMVGAMCDSEDAQLAAFAAFLKSSKLEGALQRQDWTSLARGYNGPNYAENNYDSKLSAAYDKYSAGPLPDKTVRAAQLYLTFRGFDPGPVDGALGPSTVAAILRFRQQNGASPTEDIDEALIQALTPA
jgi:hypothetical protein